MNRSTEFGEKYNEPDDYENDPGPQDPFVDFRAVLAEKHPEIARELAGAHERETVPTWLVRDNSPQYEESKHPSQIIFDAFQESTTGLERDRARETIQALVHAITRPIEENMPERNNGPAMEWREKGSHNLLEALSENDNEKYHTSINQLAQAMRFTQMGHRAEERREKEQEKAEQSANHFHQYRERHGLSDPSREEITLLFSKELGRLDPGFGAQFDALREISAGEQGANWPMSDPEKSGLLYQVYQNAVHELGAGCAARLAMYTATSLTDSLDQQNAWNVRDRQESIEIEREIKDAKISFARQIRRGNENEYVETVHEMNRIHQRIIAAGR